MTRFKFFPFFLAYFILQGVLCMAQENDSLFNKIKIRVYFNHQPDSFSINGVLFDIREYGQVVSAAKSETNNYSINASKKEFLPIRLEFNNFHPQRLNNVSLTFEQVQINFFQLLNSSKEFVSDINPKYFQYSAILLSSGCISGYSYSKIGQESYSTDVATNLRYAILAQNLIWLIRQGFKPDATVGLYYPGKTENTSFFVSLGYSAFAPFIQELEFEQTVLFKPLAYYQTYTFSNDRRNSSIFISLEKYFSRLFSISASLNYCALQKSSFVFQERLSVGSSPGNTFENVSDSLLNLKYYLLSADLNILLFKILNQEWLVSVGGYYTPTIQFEKQIFVKTSDYQYYRITPHDASYKYKSGGFGFSAGVTVHLPVTKHFSFSIQNKYLFNMKYETNFGKHKQTLSVWQSGLRYNF